MKKTDILTDLKAADDYNAAHYERDPLHARAAGEVSGLRLRIQELEEALTALHDHYCTGMPDTWTYEERMTLFRAWKAEFGKLLEFQSTPPKERHDR